MEGESIRNMSRILTDNAGLSIADAIEGISTPVIKINGNVDLSVATSSANGLMSYTDKAMLDSAPFGILCFPSTMSNVAAYHNSVFRGKNLGTSVTQVQLNAISDGTFEDLFLGDYWVISSVTYRIVAFDYYWRCGDTELNKHHIVIMPDASMMSSVWNEKVNDAHTTAGCYIGSKIRENIKAENGPQDKIIAAFGDEHVLSYRQLYPTSQNSSGSATGWAWIDARVELPNEVQIYGCMAWTDNGKGNGYEVGIDKWQLPLFTIMPSMANIRAYWWLRSVGSGTSACNVNNDGYASYNGAGDSYGVRPLSLIG